MGDEPYDPDDAAFLISRSLDRDLPDDEQQRLNRLLAESETLRAESDELRAVVRLLKRWGAQPADVDWEPFTALVQATVEGVRRDDSLRKVDQWLKRWGDRRADVDGERFTTGVMTRIGGTRRSSRYAWIFRIGAPLAAAAAIAFALTATFWSGTSGRVTSYVTIGPPRATIEPASGPTESSKRVVSFRRSSQTVGQETLAAVGISTVWASPVPDRHDEGAPL